MLDLTAIKARRAQEYKTSYKLGAAFIEAQRDIGALLLEVERLQAIEQAYKLSLAVDKYAKEIGELE